VGKFIHVPALLEHFHTGCWVFENLESLLPPLQQEEKEPEPGNQDRACSNLRKIPGKSRQLRLSGMTSLPGKMMRRLDKEEPKKPAAPTEKGRQTYYGW